MKDTDPLRGKTRPDRVGDLEAEVAQLRDDILKARQEVINLEGVVRDLGTLMIQTNEVHMSTVRELGKLQVHVTQHTPAISDALCSYCHPLEG